MPGVPYTSAERAAPAPECELVMQESSSASPPEGSGRRAQFRRRTVSPSEPQHQPVVVVSIDRAVEERLEEGLKAIETQAAALMREIAAEMWRASGSDVAGEQDRIISFLSRDQAIKSLISSADERFQTLAVRTARFEDILTDLAESTRATRREMAESAEAIRAVANSPAVHGVQSVRNQLELVENHIAAAFQHLDERDRALIEGIQARIQEHGELIARETTRIVEAMQGYVQAGAEAVGRLAQRVETHAESFAVHDDDVAERLRAVIRREIGDFAQQFELTGERIGIGQRDVALAIERMQRSLEARVMGLAQLVRSDSVALRRHVEETAAELEERIAASADARIDALTRTLAEQVAALTSAIGATVDRQVALLAETLHDRLGIMTDQIALRAAEAADIAVSSTFDQTIERLAGSIDTIESMRSSLEETTASLQERMAAHVDDRVTALAQLIRADNRVIAEHLAGSGADARAAKQTLRAVKELEAGLSGDILGSVDRRFQAVADELHRESQSTLETIAKVAEVLANKMDRLTVRVDESVGGELQPVLDRMTDAIVALARQRQGRLEVD